MTTYLENSNNQENSNANPSQWMRFLYHLAPLFFAGKPAIAVNRRWNPYGDFLGKPGGDWFTALAPDCAVRFCRLDSHTGRDLVLYYRSRELQQTLGKPDNRTLLNYFGYGPVCDLAADLNYLQTRLNGPFPHEIGIFLGIPAGDVVGFIVNKGKNYLLNGYWKVYQDPDQARRVFGEFNRAKQKMHEFIDRQLNPQKIETVAGH